MLACPTGLYNEAGLLQSLMRNVLLWLSSVTTRFSRRVWHKLQSKRKTCYLDRVEPAVAIEGEADDVRWVLVPAGVDRVAHHVSCLREDLLDEHLLAAQGDPLAQVGGDADHQAVAGLRHPPLIAILLPALQLLDHGHQLVVARLLVQQVEVLHRQMNAVSPLMCVCVRD